MNTTWDYRLIGREEFGTMVMSLHTVYYKDGAPMSYEPYPVWVSGIDKEAIKQQLDAMKEALDKPVLEGGTMFPLG